MGSENWDIKKLGNIVELKYGKSLKGYKEKTTGVPVFGTNGPIGFTEKPLTKGPGIIVGRKGAYRGVHYTPGDFYVIDTAYYLLPKINELDLKWVYYALLNKDLNSLDSGSAIPSTRKEDFYALNITVPPLSTQKKIAKFLSDIDEKIDINNEMISNLQQISETIFKEWFINFEFPNEEGKPYKSSGGEMVESELGYIPKYWLVKSLDEIAKFQNGLAMQKFRPVDNNTSLPVLKIKELNQGSTTSNSERCSLDIEEKVKVYDGDVIFSWSGTLLVKLWTGGNAGLNQHLFKVTSEKYEKWFYYLWTKYYLKVFQARAAEKATTMGHIKRSHLKEAKIYLPPQETLKQASILIQPIIEKTVVLGIENKKLAHLRDTLLPKLLTGEVENFDDLEV
ncbi:restriction endonuclease subunit S [Exiguobacterium sp.]|uniref:restriction endonuclease subunit S n=1 Tax=Exiguobacterium sp. TaxID=44751 RepID=UPI0028A9679A|nr:restriction endonuclease subunit S [Exiguobacterium sp.]